MGLPFVASRRVASRERVAGDRHQLMAPPEGPSRQVHRGTRRPVPPDQMFERWCRLACLRAAGLMRGWFRVDLSVAVEHIRGRMRERVDIG
jgi:hypothetical protein